MLNINKRVHIFTGCYGCGKTEISLSFSQELKKKFSEVALVDLDIVNPYFRSREAGEMLKKLGIRLLASAEGYGSSDLPALSPGISGALKNCDLHTVIDFGGDDTGARALGRFRGHIKETEYDMLFVVNPFRPYTSVPGQTAGLVTRIEEASRLKVTALVSNPNLLTDTTPEDVLAGHRIVVETAEMLNLPVRFAALEESLADSTQLNNLGLPILSLKRQMLKPWE